MRGRALLTIIAANAIHMKTRFIVLSIVLLGGCEESLPPRIHPLSVDLADFFELSAAPVPGVVFYQPRDSFPQTSSGSLFLSVKNTHDEVFSGHEGIAVDAKYWGTNFPTDTVWVRGDFNNLLNPFNLQGNMFMLENGILTIHPDSSANFLVVWNHSEQQFWNYANPRFIADPCQNPPCSFRIVSDTIQVNGIASITLFENQVTPLVSDPISFEIHYFFDVQKAAFARIDTLRAWVDDEGSAVIRWVAAFQSSIFRYEVQRSPSSIGGFETVQSGFVEPQGAFIDTVTYDFVDLDSDPGRWYYRLGFVEYFYPAGPFLVDSTSSIEIVLP